ncbi:MAG: hypothetical protein ACYC9S_09615 [Leptospirales bacterium]
MWDARLQSLGLIAEILEHIFQYSPKKSVGESPVPKQYPADKGEAHSSRSLAQVA